MNEVTFRDMPKDISSDKMAESKVFDKPSVELIERPWPTDIETIESTTTIKWPWPPVERPWPPEDGPLDFPGGFDPKNEYLSRQEAGSVSESDSSEKKGLTDEQKDQIREEQGWSDEIIDNIQDMKQYEALKKAGLKEVEIDGRKCLIKENIDLDYKDADGVSNSDRMARGLAPLDSKTGKPIELHHLGQKKDGPLVELTEEEHRTGEFEDGKKNQSLWHDNSKETEVHGQNESEWTQEREAHWKARSEQSSSGGNA